MMDFLEGEFLQEQVKAIKQLADYATNLKRVGPGLGEFQFDKLTLEDWAAKVLIVWDIPDRQFV